jgi:hypothetical protein
VELAILSTFESPWQAMGIKRLLCKLDPANIIGPAQRKPFNHIDVELPDIARQFLVSIAPHKKATTCNGYRQSLRHFYDFLQKSNVDLVNFSLTEMGLFQEYLFNRKLGASYQRKSLEIINLSKSIS